MSQKSTREQAVKLRAQLKSRKPTFRRQESWRYKRVSQIWRKPDGIDSKMRRKVKGWPAQAGIGYRGPRKARNIHPSGYEEVIVRNVDDLVNVDSNTQAIRIARTVGMKKRAEIYVRAGEKHLHVLNPLPEERPIEEEGAEEKAAEEEAEEAKHDTDAKAQGEDKENESKEEDKT